MSGARLPGLIAPALLGAAASAQTYEVIELGTLGGPASDAFAVNDDGAVAGRARVSDEDPFFHAFLWTEARGMQPLDNFGDGFDEAYALNNLGWAVGQAFQEDPFNVFAVVWRPGEPIDPLPALGGPISVAHGVNDAGAVVGRSQTPVDLNFATLWLPGQEPLALTELESTAMDVNEAGDVVGEIIDDEGFGVATIWHGGEPGGLPLEGLGGCTIALDVNNAGLIVGWAGLGDDDKGEFPTHGVVWDAATRAIVTELIPFGGPLFDSFALAVNDHGVVVGTADNEFNEKQAFIWDEARGMRDLNDLVEGFPWVIREARAISNTGWIAVRVNQDGLERAFVLKPICTADVNNDGALDILDFVAFQLLFVDGDVDADCNNDGKLSILDFVCFQQAFVAGCL